MGAEAANSWRSRPRPRQYPLPTFSQCCPLRFVNGKHTTLHLEQVTIAALLLVTSLRHVAEAFIDKNGWAASPLRNAQASWRA